jgi:hypothetical protein
VQREAHDVGRDHHAMAREPVRPHAADEQEHHERQGLRGEHESEVGGTAGPADHEQGERHQDDVVADHARRLREPQKAEVAVSQHATDLAEAFHAASLTRRPARR